MGLIFFMLVMLLAAIVLVIAFGAAIIANVLHSPYCLFLDWVVGFLVMVFVAAITWIWHLGNREQRKTKYDFHHWKYLRLGYCRDCGRFASLIDPYNDRSYCSECSTVEKTAARKARNNEQRKIHLLAMLEERRQQGQCAFLQAWSDCSGPPMPGSDKCAHHAKMMCSCGAPAVRECSFAGSLVCGMPLCVDHTCPIHNNGVHSGMFPLLALC